MSKAEILLACLLALFLSGCVEEKTEPPTTRKGSAVGGVTSQDIDDLAKPDPSAKPK